MVYRLKTEDINQSSLNVHSGESGGSFGVQAHQNSQCTLYRPPVRLAPFCPHVGQNENEAPLRWH
jgi:hypothetical protein